MSPEQTQVEAHYSPERRAARTENARRCTDIAIAEAHRLFFADDAIAARERLRADGFQEEGISSLLHSWSSDQ
jgi:hypothetical protein